jgi:hypothetical protein
MPHLVLRAVPVDAGTGCCEGVLHPQLVGQAFPVTLYLRHNASNEHSLSATRCLVEFDLRPPVVVVFLEEVASPRRTHREKQRQGRRRCPPGQAFMCLSRSHVTG